MASKKRKAPDYFCSICDRLFNYQSKYLRHMDTVGHKRFASIQCEGQNEVQNEESDYVLSQACHYEFEDEVS